MTSPKTLFKFLNFVPEGQKDKGSWLQFRGGFILVLNVGLSSSEAHESLAGLLLNGTLRHVGGLLHRPQFTIFPILGSPPKRPYVFGEGRLTVH